MGNLSSNSRRNSRIPSPSSVPPPSPPPRLHPAPHGYPTVHAPPPPAGHGSYPPYLPYYSYHHNNGPIPPPPYYPQNFIQSNGQYMMSLPPSQIFRQQSVIPQHPMSQPLRPPDVVEHQKASTIQNDVNLKKATLRLEKDEENPGSYLVSFSFDATAAGRLVS